MFDKAIHQISEFVLDHEEVLRVISGMEKSDVDTFEVILKHFMLNKGCLVKDVIISIVPGALPLFDLLFQGGPVPLCQ
jgi:predicted transcriptional regulator